MDKVIKIGVDTKAIDRICIGGMLYDALSYGNLSNIFTNDEEGIIISEKELLKLIDMVNRNSMLSMKSGKIKIS